MKIPNQTHIRDHKLEQQERDKRKKTKDIFTKSLLMGAAAALEKEKQEQAEREQK
jgi:G:T/U-mismatch repair DNA glycosylase